MESNVYEDLVWQSADRMSGAPCIYATRIRISDLFDWLREGGTVQSFVETYPHVPLDRVRRLLMLAASDGWRVTGSG